MARAIDGRAYFPRKFSANKAARDRAGLVDFKENVQNEAAVYGRIYRRTGDKTPARSNTKGDEARRPSRRGSRAEQKVFVLAFEVGGLRITRQPISDLQLFS